MTKQQRIESLERDKVKLLDDIYVLVDGDNWLKVVEIKKRYILLKQITETISYGSPKTKSSEQY